jgi:hypothetical protein
MEILKLLDLAWGPSRNNLCKMTQEFWRLATRDEGEYPSWIFD